MVLVTYPVDAVRAHSRKQKDKAIERVKHIIDSAKWENTDTPTSATSLLNRLLYVALSPLGGPLLCTWYGAGFVLGCVAPLRKELWDLVEESEPALNPYNFDRNSTQLWHMTEEYLGEPKQVVSDAQRMEHAKVSKCSMMALFGGCLGNALTPLKECGYLSPKRGPFFLASVFGLALGHHARKYKIERNEALIEECEEVIERLRE